MSVYLFTHLLFILILLATLPPSFLCLPVKPFNFYTDAPCHPTPFFPLFTHLLFILMPGLATMLPSFLCLPVHLSTLKSDLPFTVLYKVEINSSEFCQFHMIGDHKCINLRYIMQNSQAPFLPAAIARRSICAQCS